MREELHDWFTQLRAIAQYGLTYSKDVYDRDRFTQVRAIASAIGSKLVTASAPQLEQALALEVGPPSPKLDVRAAVFQGDAILMVQEASDQRWSLPGGWIDVGESPAHAVEREVKEETGYDCRARKLIGVFDRRRHAHSPTLLHIYKLFFWCELTGGAPAVSVETTAVDFFSLDRLPELSTARVTRAQIERAFVHRARPELPTEFD